MAGGNLMNKVIYLAGEVIANGLANRATPDAKKDEGSSALEKKTLSLYALNSSDNPGNIITQVQLKGDNYEEWARAVQTALRAKTKYGFIDGSVKQPAHDPQELEDWGTVNSMLVSWVFNTIEPTLRSTISHTENVKELWDGIRQRFSIPNGRRVQQLRTDLANCKQDGQAIVTYYGRLKTLWDELNSYDQIPICTCTGCKCNLTSKLERKREEERVHQFLMGLDEERYGTVRSNILSTEPLPNLNQTYAIVVQQERVRSMTRTREEGSNRLSFAIQAGVQNSRGDKDKSITCSNCNQEGHDANNCFQLIGYPKWWGNGACAATTGRGIGRKCGGGHNKVGPPRANATQAYGADDGQVVVANSDQRDLNGLNDDKSMTCSNCNQEGHDANNCFQLIGYPEWWGNRPREATTVRGSGRKRRGGRNKVGPPRANATQAYGADNGQVVVANSDRRDHMELTGPNVEEADWSG